MHHFVKSSLLYSLLSYASLSFAGGPLVVEGANDQTAVKYKNPNITLHAESGKLGTRSNDQADLLVGQAFALWNQVGTSSLSLIMNNEELINIDINISNFGSYLPSVDQTKFNADDNLNPLVYDTNGEIIDAFFGSGQSDFIAGFAASVFTLGNRYFDEGYAVINGKQTTPRLTDAEFKLLIAHEIGHFFGLDHSQGNINNQESSAGFPKFCSGTATDYPVMYPYVCRDVESLHTDDISALSALYPAADINASLGTLEGYFVDDTDQPILGANIWVENTTTGATYSIVSDYLQQCTGYYKLYLPEGSYTLHANSINVEFNGGSSVGPYARHITDVSFQAPHPITAISYQGDTSGNEEAISITAGQTTKISFTSSGNATEVTPVICTRRSNRDDGGSGSLYPLTLLLLFAVTQGGRCLNRSRPKAA